jgi:hypothetical protein
MAYEDPRRKERDDEQDRHRAQDNHKVPDHADKSENRDDEDWTYRYSDWASI